MWPGDGLDQRVEYLAVLAPGLVLLDGAGESRDTRRGVEAETDRRVTLKHSDRAGVLFAERQGSSRSSDPARPHCPPVHQERCA